MINKIWYWSVPDQHVLPGGEVYKGIDGPRLIQASKSPCLKGCIMKWIKQAIPNPPLCRPLEKTSSPPDLRVSEQVLIVCWRLCAPSFPCHQPSTSAPWYLEDYHKYSGEKKRDTFFQQHQLLPTRDHVHQIPSPGMLALFKKSFTKIYSPVVPCQWLCFQGSYPRCDSTTGFRTHSSPQLEQSSSLQPLKQKHFWSCELSLFDLPPTSSCCPGEQMYCIQCPVLPASHQVHGSRPWVVNAMSIDCFLRLKYEPIQAVSSSKKVAHSGLSHRVKQFMTIGNAQYSHLKRFHLQSRKLESCTWAEDFTHVSSLPLPMPGVGGTQAELNSD